MYWDSMFYQGKELQRYMRYVDSVSGPASDDDDDDDEDEEEEEEEEEEEGGEQSERRTLIMWDP